MSVEILEKLRRREMLHKAKIFFERCLDFTTGPVELPEMIARGDQLNIIDVRKPVDYVKGQLAGLVRKSVASVVFRGEKVSVG